MTADLALWMPCPTCGHRVRVVSGDEGTSYFEPVEPDEAEAVAVRNRELARGVWALPDLFRGHPLWGNAIDRDAVLRLIEGER